MQKKTRSRLLTLQIVGSTCLNLSGSELGSAQNTANFLLPPGSRKGLSQATGLRNGSHRYSFCYGAVAEGYWSDR